MASLGIALVVGETYSSDLTEYSTYHGYGYGINGSNGDAGGVDAFVTILEDDGSSVRLNSYWGGDGYDSARGIAIDSSSETYISFTGFTNSSDFNTTSGAFQETLGGQLDAFITEFRYGPYFPLMFSTYIGGKGCDYAYDLVRFDSGGTPSDEYFIAGKTNSSDFPFSSSYHSYKGEYDAFGAVLSEDGSVLFVSSYFGGANDDCAYGLDVDTAANVYLTGHTYSGDFPVLEDAYQSTHEGGAEVFVTRVEYDDQVPVIAGSVPPEDAVMKSGTIITLDITDAGVGMSHVIYNWDGGSNTTIYYPYEVPAPTGDGDYELNIFAYDLVGNMQNVAWIYTTDDTNPDIWLDWQVNGSTWHSGTLIELYPNDAHPDTVLYYWDSAALNTTYAGELIPQPIGNGAHALHVFMNDTAGNWNHTVFVFYTQDTIWMLYSTYLGGSDIDVAYDVALDSDDNCYVTGYTTSTDFPITPGVINETANGDKDVFVTKLNSTGSGLIYSTYFGGAANDSGISIVVDDLGNVYVAGVTNSTDFPVTPGANQTTYGGGLWDAFVFKLNASGTGLNFSTFLGGSNIDYIGHPDGSGKAIGINANYDVYVCGWTNSTDYPITPGVDYETYGGDPSDGFLTRLNYTGKELNYSTYFDESGELEALYALAVLPNDGCYAVGRIVDDYLWLYFTSSGHLDDGDAHGGSGVDFATGVCYYPTYDELFIVGQTSSTNLPLTEPFQDTYGGGTSDAFITYMQSESIMWQTYFGGSGRDCASDILYGGIGLMPHVVGTTDSPDFPFYNAFDSEPTGTAAFVAEFMTFTEAYFITLLDGDGDDYGYGISGNSNSEIYVVGETNSTDYPKHSYQESFAGVVDGFITKFTDDRHGPDVDPVYPDESVLNSGTWIGLNVTDDYSGIYRVYYSWDEGTWIRVDSPYEVLIPSAPGAHDLDVHTIDNLGNEEFYYYTYHTDDDPPTIWIDEPDVGSVNPSLTYIYVNYDDMYIQFPILHRWDDNLTYIPLGGEDETQLPVGDGVHVLHVMANDSAGNTAYESFTFTTDDTDPVVTILYPGINYIVPYGMNATFTVSDLNLKEVWYSWGDPPELITPPYQIPIPESDGWQELSIWAFDNASNLGYVSIEFYVDGTPPYLDIEGPNPGEVYYSGEEIWMYVDEVNPNTTIFNWDMSTNQTVEEWDIEGDDEYWFMTYLPYGNGLHTLYVYCNDSASNQAKYNVSFYTLDSSVMPFSTFFGGSGADAINDIVTDINGSIYITGYTSSVDFPTYVPYLLDYQFGIYDAFVSKLNYTGQELIYSTYMGGLGTDIGNGIDVDEDGYCYITGETNSTNYPMSIKKYQGYQGGYDAFITRLKPSGGLNYSTYIGGSNEDRARDIDIDADGNAYITGWTASSNFPVYGDPYQDTYGGGTFDAFVLGLNATGNGLEASTFLGGSDNDRGYGITLEFDIYPIVAGGTESTDFPLAAPDQGTIGGLQDAFVTWFEDLSLDSLDYSTYLGGSKSDEARSVTIDTPYTYVTGWTASTNFPTDTAFQEEFGGGTYDAFYTQYIFGMISSSTFIGGTGNDIGMAIDYIEEFPIITGKTESPDFSIFNTLYEYSGGSDAFAVGGYPWGNWGFRTLIGGSSDDVGRGIAPFYDEEDGSYGCYVAGRTTSTDYPVFNAYQATHGGNDAFITQVVIDNGAPSISLANATDGQVIHSNVSIRLDVVDAYHDVDVVQFRWGKNPYTPIEYPYHVTTPSGYGLYYLDVKANDTLGYEDEPTRFLFFIDDSPPEISLAWPSNGTWAKSGTSIGFSVDDAVLNTTLWNWDGTANTTGGDENTVYFPVGDGMHELFVYANDSLNNWAFARYVFYTDDSWPTIELLHPLNNTEYHAQQLIIIDANDPNLDKVWYNWDDGTNSTWTSMPNTTTLEPAIGVHWLHVFANDTFGQQNNVSFRFTTDNEIPLIALVSPDDNTVHNSGTEIKVAITSVTLDTILWNWDGGVNSSDWIEGINTAELPSAETLHTLHVYANNSAGVWRYEWFTFTTDDTDPYIGDPTPGNESYGKHHDPIALDISDLHLHMVRYNWDGMSNNTLAEPFELEFITPNGDGWHTLHLYVNDTAGNTAYKKFLFYTDVTDPHIYGEDPVDDWWYKPGTIITVNVTETNLVDYIYNWDGGTNSTFLPTNQTTLPLERGSHTLHVYASDKAGNWDYVSFLYHTDGTPPNITLSEPANFSVHNSGTTIYLYINDTFGLTNTIWLTWYNWDDGDNDTLSGGLGHIWYPGDSLPVGDGIHILNIYANDSASNFAYKQYAFITDDTEPFFTLLTPENDTLVDAAIPVGVQVNDSAHTLHMVWWYWSDDPVNNYIPADGNTTFYTETQHEDGIYELHVWANDTAGNENYTMYIFDVDGASPDITLENVADNAVLRSNSTIDVDVSDSHLDTVFYAWDEPAYIEWLPLYINETPTGDGLHYLFVYANDSLGHETNVTFTFTVDDTKPVITLRYPLNETALHSDSLVDVDVTDPNLEEVLYHWDYQGGNYTWFEPYDAYTPLGAGDHILHVYAGDVVDNWEYVIFIFTTNEELPGVNHPADITMGEGQTGFSFTWVATSDDPNQYTIYEDGVPIETDAWDSGEDIPVNLDGYAYGVYNFTIWLTDGSSNVARDWVFVTVTDITPPVLDHPDDLDYSEGTTGNTITWSASDLHPVSYRILLDGDEIKVGLWNLTVESISYSVDGYGVGVYNFTVVVEDIDGNWASDVVIVTVYDDTAPQITSPDDINYVEGATGYNITWTIIELHPASFVVYRNGVEIDGGPWDGSAIVIFVDGLAIGDYNYTLVVFDESGNNSTDTVWVYVASAITDTTPPTINHPADILFDVNMTGYSITWNPADANPVSYQILLNGSELFSGLWNSTGETMTVSLDGLAIGVYNYTIVVTDIGGYTTIDTVIVTVVDDLTIPTIDSPDNQTIYEGSTMNSIVWSPSDDYPVSYQILRDGSELVTDDWDGGNISISIDGLGLGTYNYTIVVFDIGGNSVTDTVWITVLDGTAPTIDSPADIEYEVGETGNSITWTPTDLHPASYTIYRDSTVIESDDWDGGTITINVDGLSAGSYNYTLVVTDVGGNTATDTVIVTVTTPTTTPTTTTTTPPTNTTTTTTTPPDLVVLVIAIAGAGGAIIVVIIIFLYKKGKLPKRGGS